MSESEQATQFGDTGWWEADGSYSLLRAINPTRLSYVQNCVGELAGKATADIGCGGGIFSEALAQCEAKVTGFDESPGAINTAIEHAKQTGLSIDYQVADIATIANKAKSKFELVTCLEVLEHVADPQQAIQQLAGMLTKQGDLIISTINRNPLAYVTMISLGENFLKLLPQGTHSYEGFIRPTQLASWCQEAGLKVLDITGLNWSFFGKRFTLSSTVMPVNYFLHAKKL